WQNGRSMGPSVPRGRYRAGEGFLPGCAEFLPSHDACSCQLPPGVGRPSPQGGPSARGGRALRPLEKIRLLIGGTAQVSGGPDSPLPRRHGRMGRVVPADNHVHTEWSYDTTGEASMTGACERALDVGVPAV